MMEEQVQCHSCPIQCKIRPGNTGACKRFTNVNGVLERNRPLAEASNRAKYEDSVLQKPVVTAVGAGTTYPCMKPAPFIVSEVRDDVEVVTVVTEAPLSYSGVIVKVDTNQFLGEAGEKIYAEDAEVGMLLSEEYGSKMLSIGGATLFTSKSGLAAVRTVTALANGEEKTLQLGKHRLTVQAGQAPVIDGKVEERMRFGCGSATIGIFAAKMKEAADDVIVLDHHIIGLLSEHLAGEEVGMSWSGIIIQGKKSSRGRYFGMHGDGVGGTAFLCAIDVVKGVDKERAKPGMTLFITDTIGETREYFELDQDFNFRKRELPPKAEQLADEIAGNCEKSLVSVVYTGGAGGSARGGVTRCPIKLTEAVHAKKVKLTIGGAPAFVMPGGGINFLADTQEMVENSFYWVPTPATVAPIEYTMTRSEYEKIEGHTDCIISVEEMKKRCE